MMMMMMMMLGFFECWEQALGPRFHDFVKNCQVSSCTARPKPHEATQPRLFFALGHRHDLHHHRRHVDVVTLIACEMQLTHGAKKQSTLCEMRKNQTVCRTPVNTIKQQHLQVRLSPLFHGFMYFSKPPPQPQDSVYSVSGSVWH